MSGRFIVIALAAAGCLAPDKQLADTLFDCADGPDACPASAACVAGRCVHTSKIHGECAGAACPGDSVCVDDRCLSPEVAEIVGGAVGEEGEGEPGPEPGGEGEGEGEPAPLPDG